MSASLTKSKRKTILNYEITPWQDALFNFLVPSASSLILYVLIIASDCALVFRHFKDNNPIWASVTIFVMFLPSICSYIVIVSSWELWPQVMGCGRDNLVWFYRKTGEHLLFPAWAMWRYAERMFWSIEAIRSKKDEEVVEATGIVSAPRTIELYFFFQAFLHSLPQMLIQLNILMRQDYHVNRQTADAEILSLVFNLTKLASTIAFYQRFKSQKLAGKQYPWFKSYKNNFGRDDVDKTPIENEAIMPQSQSALPQSEPVISDSRRSSDFYLEPSIREAPTRETSIVDGPQRQVFQEVDEPDFNIRRIANIKGLPEDDLAGKLVSFCWWSCFLVARILAISTFFYFYPRATMWLLASHVVIVLAALIYDVRSNEVERAKLVFFAFLGVIYIFCIIEFKIKFKKTKYVYGGYFCLVFLQNIIMCMVWWFNNVDDLKSDFWFRYILFIVTIGSMLSVSSMILYLCINKPEKVVVGQKFERTST